MKKKSFLKLFIMAVFICSFSLAGCSFIKFNYIDISECSLSFFKSVTYTGKPLKVNIRIIDNKGTTIEFIDKDISHSDFDVFYENNINVGTATIKVVAKNSSKKYKGELKGSFQIKGTTTNVDNINDLIDDISSGNYTEIKMNSDLTIDDGQTLFIHKNTTLNLNGHTLTNNGSIEQKGILKLTFNNSPSVVINNGSYFLNNANKNEGVMQRIRGALFYNYGEFKFVNSTIEGVCNYSYFYSNTDIKDINGKVYFDKFNSSNYFYRRYPISDFDYEIESADNYFYTGRAICPNITITKEGQVFNDEYSVKYENNINAGTAKIIVTANKDSKYCYGTHTFNFEIKKASMIYNNDCKKSLQYYIDSENYNNIRMSRPLNEDIIIPNYLTITFQFKDDKPSNSTFDINNEITNNGTLIFADNVILNNQNNSVSIINNGILQIGQNVSVNLKSPIVNNATFENKGNIFIGDTSNICNTTIENLGNIYYNIDEQLFNTVVNKNNAIKRKSFVSVNNLIFEKVIYDGYRKYLPDYAKFKAEDGTIIDVSNKDYIISCNTEIKNAGNYNIEIEFNNNSTYFYGKDNAIFNISKASKIISLASNKDTSDCIIEFIDDVRSGNYYSLTADFNFSFFTSSSDYQSMYIPSDLTVVIPQGRKFFNNSYLSEWGNIWPCLEVDGEIINNGTYIEQGDINADFGYTISNEEVITKGKFINNGIAYFNKVAEINKPNIPSESYYYYPNITTGTVYIREHINEGIQLPKIEPRYFNFTYEKSNWYPNENIYEVLTPNIETILTKTNITLTKNKDYTYTCQDFEKASIVDDCNSYRNKFAYVVIKIEDVYSQILYGSTRVDYKILPGTAKVAHMEGFMNALNSISFDPAYCNHNKIELIGDVESYEESRNVVILKNTTVYTNGYKLKINHYPYSSRITNHGVICIQSREGVPYENLNDYVSLMINHNISTGSIVGYAKTVNEFYYMTLGCDTIHLLCDVSNLNKYGSPEGISATPINTYFCDYKKEENPKKLKPVKIYLNGHTINKLSVNMRNRDIEICGGSEIGDCGKANIDELEIRGSCNINIYKTTLDYLDINVLNYATEYYKDKVILSETVKYQQFKNNPFS